MGGEPRRNRNSPPTSTPAYTLVELVVVIGVISLLMAVTIPSVSWMWESSRLADAENKLTGLLRSARMRSLNKADSGLFFFIENGVQKIAFIEAEPVDLTAGSVDFGFGVVEQDVGDRFRVLTDTVYDLRAPFRVVPLDTLDPTVWDDTELGTETYDDLDAATDGNRAQNHRNYFTLIFSPAGHLIVDRSILIHDTPTASVPPLPSPGEITGLMLDDATQFQGFDGTAQAFGVNGLPEMIVADGSALALNFPSVDGLLVYDDTLFRGYPDDAVEPIENKRRFLMRTARPFYISRQTGAIIKGPRGENEP